MKKIIRLLSIILIIFCLCCGCDCSSTQEESGYKGVHNYNLTETNDYLVYDGKTDYVVVVPSNASSFIRTASTEFCYLFKMATGIEMKSVVDSSLANGEHLDSNTYISIGETSLLKSTNVTHSLSELSYDGGKIITKGKTIYIIGGYDTGSLFAVYRFMNLTFNYECYYSSCIEIDKNVRVKHLYNYDVTDVPDFKSRSVGLGSGKSVNFKEYDQVNFQYRMGYSNTYNESSFRAHQVYDDPESPTGFSVDSTKYAVSTNTDTIINKNRTGASHPSWFSDAGNQLCYTAHGDSEEFDKLTTALAHSVIYGLKTYTKDKYPLRDTFSITAEDNDFFCTCEACSNNLGKYGTHAGSIIKCLNEVAKKVNVWLDEGENRELYAREDFIIMFFAYGAPIAPPTVYDEAKDKYLPVDQTVICHENVGINYANIHLDYQQSVYAEDNKFGDEYLKGWSAVTDEVVWFTYNTNRRGFPYFYDSFNHYTNEGFQYYASISDRSMYVESQTNNPNPTCWYNLKFYLVSKLQWDTSLDVNQLTDNFFNAMFGQGAKYMREFFDAERMYCYNTYKEAGFHKKWSIYNYVNKDCEWPISVLNYWIDCCDKALKAVEPLKEIDPIAYDNYCKHIEIEAVSPIVIMFEQNADALSVPQKKAYLDRLTEDLNRWDFSQMLIVHVAYQTPTMLPEWIELQSI